jgi:hypothetical protein
MRPGQLSTMSKPRRSPYYVAPKSAWRRLFPLIAVLATIGVIALLFVSRSSSDRDIVGLNDLGGEGVLHRVYLDGWSYRTLQDTVVKAGTEGAASSLTFSPLDAEGVDEALQRDPEIVQNMLARLVTGDASLRCSTSGCTTSAGRFDHQVLGDLTKVDVFGSMYQAWRVSAGLYVAEFRAPANSVISIGADGWADLVVREAPVFADGETTVVGEFGTVLDISDLPEASDALYGYGRRSWDVAAAFGTFFIPEVHWDDEDPEISARGTGSTVPVQTAVANELEAGFLAHGLADIADQPAFAGLDNSQITYLSSPVTGCGVAALCVPASLSVQVTPVSRETAKVCSVDGRYAVAVALTSNWEATLVGQTHVFGAWNGKDPASFKGAGHPSALGYSGLPELVGGQLSTRQTLVALVDANGTVFALAGARAQVGVDPVSATNAKMDLAELEQFFNGNWKRC